MNSAISIEERVKFSEVDSMGIMWHGHYIRFFEEAREQFGLKNGLDYLSIYKLGYFTPIIKTEINHHAPLSYGDTAIIEATYCYSRAAKIIFEYKVYSKLNNKLAASGKTIQVFLDKDMTLQITNPSYYEQWKMKYENHE